MLAFAVRLSIGFMHRGLFRAIIVADLFTSVAESTHTWAAQASATQLIHTVLASDQDLKCLINCWNLGPLRSTVGFKIYCN